MLTSIKGAFLLFYALLNLAFGTEAVSLENQHYGVVEDRKELAAAAYHGIKGGYVTGLDGVHRFWRDGQWCKMFNGNFNRKWNRRGGGDE